MTPIVALGILVALEAAVIYVVADDVLTLASPITGTQAAWLGVAAVIAPAVIFAAL